MQRPLAPRTLPGAVLAAAALACALGVAAELGPAPPAPAAPRARPPARREDRIELAGSGSNVPLTRALAARWPSPRRAVVHESIGSTGALRALRDGAIDVGLVSRPLSPGDLRGGLRATPYARTEVILVAHPSVTARALSPDALRDILRGARTRWDDGAPLTFVLRERGDSSHRALAAAIPGFAEAEADAQRARRFRVMYRDDDLRAAVAETPGALGVADRGGTRLGGEPVVSLAIEGAPPPIKDLSLVLRDDASPAARDFVAFATSPAARALIADAGYLLPEPP